MVATSCHSSRPKTNPLSCGRSALIIAHICFGVRGTGIGQTASFFNSHWCSFVSIRGYLLTPPCPPQWGQRSAAGDRKTLAKIAHPGKYGGKTGETPKLQTAHLELFLSASGNDKSVQNNLKKLLTVCPPSGIVVSHTVTKNKNI